MEKYMEIAYKEAIKAFKKNEIPVGAVIVKNNKILAKARNTRQYAHNLLGHAEINCIIKAEKKLKDWRLDECVLYVTLEPCEMCKIHIKESRINKVIYLLSKKSVKNEQNFNFLQTNDCERLKKSYQLLINQYFENLRK